MVFRRNLLPYEPVQLLLHSHKLIPTPHRECPHYSNTMAPICSNYSTCQEILQSAGQQGSSPQTPSLYITHASPGEYQTHKYPNPHHLRPAPISHPWTFPPPCTSYRSSFPSSLVSHGPNRLFLLLISRPFPEPELPCDLLPRNDFQPLSAPQASFRYTQ